MGCTVKDKHIRANRRTRSAKPHFDPCCYASSISKSILELGLQDSTQMSSNPNSNTNSSDDFDDNEWDYCTEEELEEILLRNLEYLYKEAVSKLVALGYDEDVALKAILCNGHCYGDMDVLTNIMHNALAYLNSSPDDSSSSNNSPVFSDLEQLKEYSLAGMVYWLQQFKPHLSKGDAMWCLMMSDLHVGRASAIDIPAANAPGNGNGIVDSSMESVGSNGVDNGVGMVAPALCKFHGGWGSGNGGGQEFAVNQFFAYSAEMTVEEDTDCSRRFNLSPLMKSLLKRNVAAFAAGFRANSMQMQSQAQSQASTTVVSGGDVSQMVTSSQILVESGDESQNLKNQDGVNAMLSKFCDLNLGENLELAGEHQKDGILVTLLQQIKDLERQVKERKEWAHEKAVQAARKLSNDLTELKMLRMEKEEIQQIKKEKQALEDSTMKKLSEMENDLRKASSQVDRTNAAVRRLETENAEIRAEMEAAKLSASESVSTCLEVAKREKRWLKKLLAWEKMKAKLLDEIADEKEKIKELQQCLAKAQQAQNEAEVKWKWEVKEKEQALGQVEEERRSKEAAEAFHKRKLDSLLHKIEIDFQRHKDDLQRLEQEFSRLKSSADYNELNNQLTSSPEGKPARTMPQGETIAKLLVELSKMDDSSDKGTNSRECMICMKDEVSIVFLPCAHQVMCTSCSDNYVKKGKATCPCCQVQVERRIRIFGASL